MGNVVAGLNRFCRRNDTLPKSKPGELKTKSSEVESSQADFRHASPQSEQVESAPEEKVAAIEPAMFSSVDHSHGILMISQVTRIKTWHKLFKQHSKNSTLGSVSKGLYTFPTPRNLYCNEQETMVFHDIKNPSTVLVALSVLDMHKFARVLASDDYKKMNADLGVVEAAPPQKLEPISTMLTVPPLHRDMVSEYGTASVAMLFEVEDFDWWHEGFMQHGHSTTGSWGFEVTMPRSDYTHEHRTHVFRGVDNPSQVAVLLYGVDLETFDDLVLKDASFLRLRGALGEKGQRSVMVMSDEKSLQTVDLDCTKMLCSQR